MRICGVGLLPTRRVVSILGDLEIRQIVFEEMMHGSIDGHFTLLRCGFAYSSPVS